jgi:hypothetical protein
MIEFKHNGFQMSCQKYDGVDVPRWNFEIEPFVVG